MATARDVSEAHPTQGDTSPVGPTTRRLIYALALLPIVPATAIIGLTAIEEILGASAIDEERWAHLLISVLFVGGTIAIWRKAVLWTLGRKWLTALVAFVPFVQVVYAQPLWDAGCTREGTLRVGQHELGIGLWIWLSIWVWWGWEKTQMTQDKETSQGPAVRISSTARRLAASIGTIPFVFGVFLIALVALEDAFGLSNPVAEAYAPAAVIAVTLWILIWRKGVAWSRPVINRTAIVGLLGLAVPITIYVCLDDRLRGNDLLYFIVALLPVIGWGAWMAVTIRIWPLRQTGEYEGDRSPRCLRCGYLLIGLSSTRCPECGDEPTLDELWRALFATEV